MNAAAASQTRYAAEALLASLRPITTRAEIAGSIRRLKPNPRDIEIVAILRDIEKPQLTLFETKPLTALVDVAEWLKEQVDWEFDRLQMRHGPRWFRLAHKRLHNWAEQPLACDLFTTTPEHWAITMTLRTGPGDFSTDLVTLALKRGMQVKQNQLWRKHNDGRLDLLPMGSEQDLFEALRIPWLEPQARQKDSLKRLLYSR